MTARTRAYWKKVSDRNRQRAKRGWEKRRAQSAEPPDADTMRWRALQDRKGDICATLKLSNGPSYVITHSRRRTDSYDVELHYGRVVKTGGRVAIGRFLASIL